MVWSTTERGQLALRRSFPADPALGFGTDAAPADLGHGGASTAYVAGKREFATEDIVSNSEFNNRYEESKHFGEKLSFGPNDVGLLPFFWFCASSRTRSCFVWSSSSEARISWSRE